MLVTIGDDASVVLQDRETGEVVHELAGLEDADVADGSPVHDVAFSVDGAYVAAAGVGGRWSCGRSTTAPRSARWSLDHDAARVALSPHGEQVGVSGGGPVELYDVSSADRIITLADDSPDGSGLAWSPDGRWLVAPAADGAPTIWDNRSLTEVDQLPGVRLDEAAFSPDSRQVALDRWRDDGAVVDAGGPGPRPRRARRGARGGRFRARPARTLYSVSGTDGILAWDVRTGEMTDRFELPEK